MRGDESERPKQFAVNYRTAVVLISKKCVNLCYY